MSAYDTRICVVCGQQGTEVMCGPCVAHHEARMKRIRRHQGNEAMLAVGVPEVLAAARSDSVSEWDGLTEHKSGLYLHGRAGRGKSFTAACILRARLATLAERVRPEVEAWWMGLGGTKFVRVDAMLQDIRERSFGEGATEGEFLAVQSYARTSFLVLDDLGSEKRSEWGAQTLHSLLDHRLGKGSRTIITSNFTLDDLTEMYAAWGEPIVSRINKICVVREVTGQDRRVTS